MANKRMEIRVALNRRRYNETECLFALRGERIPSDLGNSRAQRCLVRGIRHHPGFATELHGCLPLFTRALNARAIMSNAIPEMNEANEFPYCIWHPDVATEATYRELARRYPEQMRYLVGRACAVAGYTGLYNELDLLSEVHIAEEARTNGHTVIFDAIMAAPVRYEVLDDYNRTVNEASPKVAWLNDDTATRQVLGFKRGLVCYGFGPTIHFDITEDCGFDEDESPRPSQNAESILPLLYNSLPLDLPAIDKDILIVMAAWYGDIDRYARLRRPSEAFAEHQCVLRGIYTNTLFAKWWSLQLPPEPFESDSDDDSGSDSDDNSDDDEEEGIFAKLSLGEDSLRNEEPINDTIDHIVRDESTPAEPWYFDRRDTIEEAITARFIMNNDLSMLYRKDVMTYCPHNIFHPTVPCEETLEELFRIKPEMKPQVVRACIIGNYQDFYDRLDPDADQAFIDDARRSTNPHYREHLEAKANAGRWDSSRKGGKLWFSVETTRQWSSTDVLKSISEYNVVAPFMSIFGGDNGADPAIIEHNVCIPDRWREDPPAYLKRG